jgi:hypothetical protein
MGVAFVIVNHIRTIPTRLHETLPDYTSMPVNLITEDLYIEKIRFISSLPIGIYMFFVAGFSLNPFQNLEVGLTLSPYSFNL